MKDSLNKLEDDKMPDYKGLIAQLKLMDETSNNRWEQIPSLIAKEIERQNLVSSFDLDRRLENYSPSVDIAASIQSGLAVIGSRINDEIKEQFDAIIKTMQAQQVTLNLHSEQIRTNTAGDATQQQLISDLMASHQSLQRSNDTTQTDVKSILDILKGEGQDVGIVGRIKSIEDSQNIADAARLDIYKKIVEAKSVNDELTLQLEGFKAREQQRDILVAQRKEDRKLLIEKIRQSATYVITRGSVAMAGTGAGATALASLYHILSGQG
jgi:hypothetical protein